MDKDESLKQEPIRGWFTADEFVEMADRRTKEWAKQADIPDLIAGALGVSRGTAYDMMREVLKEALLVQEPEIVQRVRRYAGQTMRTARNPNITARECIELANWLAANTTPPAAQPSTVPEGWKLVPVNPTPEMLAAADQGNREYTLRNFGDIQTVMQGPEDHYAAMLNAAPAAQPAMPLTPKEIAEFVGTHEFGPEQLKWFRLGEAAHGITKGQP